MQKKEIRYQITFAFEFIEQVDYILKDIKVIHKSFEKKVSYVIILNECLTSKIFYALYLTTAKQIKIVNLTNTQIYDEQEVGTDKPIGSKDAIDEN